MSKRVLILASVLVCGLLGYVMRDLISVEYHKTAIRWSMTPSCRKFGNFLRRHSIGWTLDVGGDTKHEEALVKLGYFETQHFAFSTALSKQEQRGLLRGIRPKFYMGWGFSDDGGSLVVTTTHDDMVAVSNVVMRFQTDQARVTEESPNTEIGCISARPL